MNPLNAPLSSNITPRPSSKPLSSIGHLNDAGSGKPVSSALGNHGKEKPTSSIFHKGQQAKPLSSIAHINEKQPQTEETPFGVLTDEERDDMLYEKARNQAMQKQHALKRKQHEQAEKSFGSVDQKRSLKHVKKMIDRHRKHGTFDASTKTKMKLEAQRAVRNGNIRKEDLGEVHSYFDSLDTSL